MNHIQTLLSAVVLLQSPSAVFSQQSRPAPLPIEKTIIAPDVYLFRSVFDGYVETSAVVAVNESDVLVFDTHTRPSSAFAVLAEIRKITRKPVRYVVNSHWHPDHWSGNQVYADSFPGVQIIATEQTTRYMRNVAPGWLGSFQGMRRRAQEAFAQKVRTGKLADSSVWTPEMRKADSIKLGTTVSMIDEVLAVRRTFPTSTFSGSLTLRSGSREFRFIEATGDATGSTVVYLPNEKVILLGDLLVYPGQWGSNGYALAPWLASLRELGELDFTTVVPGHGPVFRDRQYFNLVTELFATVTSEVERALREGNVTPDEVAKAVKLDGIRAKFAAMKAEFDDDIITMAYREARDGMQSRR